MSSLEMMQSWLSEPGNVEHLVAALFVAEKLKCNTMIICPVVLSSLEQFSKSQVEPESHDSCSSILPPCAPPTLMGFSDSRGGSFSC